MERERKKKRTRTREREREREREKERERERERCEAKEQQSKRKEHWRSLMSDSDGFSPWVGCCSKHPGFVRLVRFHGAHTQATLHIGANDHQITRCGPVASERTGTKTGQKHRRLRL
jgi:hypothetical protein